jgi:hypothetical protein
MDAPVSDGKPTAEVEGEISPPSGHDASEDNVRAEFEAILEADDTGLGDVWRRTRAHETPDQIAAAHGAQTSSFVWNYQRTARALTDGDLPKAPSLALAVSRTFRRILKEEDLTLQARHVLDERLAQLEVVAANADARVAEDKQAARATVQAEENAVPGVYVYALPHYLRYPYDEESGRTLLKVGRADSSVIRSDCLPTRQQSVFRGQVDQRPSWRSLHAGWSAGGNAITHKLQPLCRPSRSQAYRASGFSDIGGDNPLS